MRRLLLKTLPAVVLFVPALIVRLLQHHAALLYPDGYQYLLMARGIGEHLQPTTMLGAGGDHFVPNPDAAAKPFFPLLVAAVHALGVSWPDAARIVTVTAAAAVVVIVGLLAVRLSGSLVAGAAAAALVLASPSVALWSGFSGPDPLAQALALGAALAFSHRRPRIGGVLAGLAVATRPELAAVAIVGAVAGARRSDTKPLVWRGAVSFALTLFVIVGALRPSIAFPELRLVAVAALIIVCAAIVARLAPSSALIVVAGLAFVGVAGVRSSGLAELWHGDWPLLAMGLGGLIVLALTTAYAEAAAGVLIVAVVLGAIYVVKNPALERYFALELPLAALLAGLAIAALRGSARAVPVGAVALAVLASIAHPPAGSRDLDVFTSVAPTVRRTLAPGDVLLTAAPDAYGLLLPGERVRALRVGERGYVLLDAAQRAYAPGLTARGRVVARFDGNAAFSRPDGEIDPGSAVLVHGEVVAAPAAQH